MVNLFSRAIQPMKQGHCATHVRLDSAYESRAFRPYGGLIESNPISTDSHELRLTESPHFSRLIGCQLSTADRN